MSKTKIEWATHTWNPITGCTPISEGCQHCYAARMAKRLAGRGGYPKDDPFRPGTVHKDKFTDPLVDAKVRRIRRNARVFVCSMGDIFHDDVSISILDEIFGLMANAHWIFGHTFMVLTKRPKRMRDYMKSLEEDINRQSENHELHFSFPLKGIWLGVTCENQARADERIPILLQIPAAVRFVSVEPMLGPIDLVRAGAIWADLNGEIRKSYQQIGRTIDWIICGGETGPGARPMHPEWARSLRDQCKDASVPFFFKNWGARVYKNGKIRRDGILDGKEYKEFPEV